MITDQRVAGLPPRLGEYRLLGGAVIPPDTGQGDLSVIPLALFDHDYVGTHAYVQAWDHDDPSDGWVHLLLLLCGELGWEWRIAHDWGTDRPSFREVGERVDLYVTAPENLRFILR